MTMRKGLPAKLALTDADDTRYDFRNLVVCNADGSPRQGITSPVGTNLVTGTAGMTVNVSTFSAVAARDNGAILLSNEGVTAVTIPTAPLSNSRWDLVCARQDDASTTVSTPDADNIAKLYVVSGGSAPSPTPPALPAGSVEVGRVLNTAGNTNTNAMTIVQATQYTAGSGAAFPVPNQTQKGLLPALRPSQRIWLMDSLTEEVWDGTNWRGAPWVTGTLAAGWASGGSAGGGTFWAPFRYRLNALGEVEIQGQITPPAAVAPSAVFFTLPPGFRPSAQLEFPCSINTNAGRTLAGCQITAAGAMSFSAGSIQNVNLGQIVFATN